jgi:seryl-tRNA(Sec) selenium transferase
MFKAISQYFAGVGRAMRVRSGRVTAHAERLKAYAELSRVEQAIPAARAEAQIAKHRQDAAERLLKEVRKPMKGSNRISVTRR